MVIRTSPRRGRRAAGGHTYIELLVTTIVLLVLAGAVLPVAETSRRREKEVELRRALRDIRSALAAYHRVCRTSLGQAGAVTPPGGQQGMTVSAPITIKIEDDPGLTCYPKDLDVLIEGVETGSLDYKLRFLRRIPRDPFNVSDDEHDQHGWRLISTTQRPESNVGWDRGNVFDVRSGSEGSALDGSKLEDW